MRSLIITFCFHLPPPCDLPILSMHVLDLRHRAPAGSHRCRTRGRARSSAAFCSTVRFGIGFEIAEDPALALGHGLVAELLRSDLVAPLAEGAFGELLDVALVHQRDGFALVVDRVLDGDTHQPLGAGDGDGLDADAGVGADLLLALPMSLFRKSMSFFASGVPSRNSMPE